MDDKTKLINVIPIAKGITKEQLTYFSSKKIKAGFIVSVPLRKKEVNAVVLSVEDAHLSKAQLKSSAYSLKKINSIVSQTFLLPEFVATASQIGKYYASTTGAVLSTMLPSAISAFPKELEPPASGKKKPPSKKSVTANIKQQPYLLQSDDSERTSIYKSIIREEFAKRKSVFFCLPEISEIEHTKEKLSRGIENYTYIFHSNMTKKKVVDMWNAVLSEQHPVLIIATGQFLSIPREDLGAIILEKESSRSYKRNMRPYLDIRKFAEQFAQQRAIKFILGDIFLRPETIYSAKNGNATELSPLKFRSLSTAKQKVIDMKMYKKEGSKTIELFSDELRFVLESLQENNENAFMLTSKRGLYPTTVCNDCGNTVICEKCSAPTVLHRSTNRTEKNLAFCHKCGLKQTASDKCSTCGGWRLATLGIGIEHIEEEINKQFPGIYIFRVDKDVASTHKKVLAILDKFYSTPSSILLGTEMAVPYLNKDIDNAVVVSVDSLFTIPDFHISERVFSLLLRLRARATKTFLIQTRDIENRIFEYAINGNLIDFYREEIAERKILKYPPFVRLVKISLEGQKQSVEKTMSALAEKLAKYEPALFPAFTAVVKGKYRINILIKLSTEENSESELFQLLSKLPPQFAIRIDPEDIL